MVEEAAACQQGDGLLAGIGEVIVFLTSGRRRAHAQDAVFRLQDHFAVLGDVVGHGRRLANAQVHVGAVMDVLRHAGGQLVFRAFLVAAHGLVSCFRLFS
jgi:hypothetical protein